MELIKQADTITTEVCKQPATILIRLYEFIRQ